MGKEIIEIQNDKSDNPTGWESVAEMAEDGAGKGMESLADEPSFEEHMAGKGGEKKTGGFFGGMREKLASMVHEERVKRQEAKIRAFGLSSSRRVRPLMPRPFLCWIENVSSFWRLI